MNKSSYDPLTEMFTTFAPIGVIFFIVAFLFFVIGIAYIVRLWFVQTATFQIQKDLAEIKDYLIQKTTGNVGTTQVSESGNAIDQDVA